MPTALMNILDVGTLLAKENIIGEVVCPVCGERIEWIRYGYYTRYLFSGEERIDIQRYLCQNPKCPRRTFSLLPYPLLPILRVSLCFILVILAKYEGGEGNIGTLGRASGKKWGVIRRGVTRARQVRQWVKNEWADLFLETSTHIRQAMYWNEIIRSFSWAIFPVRFGKSPPTQNVYR